MAPRILALTFIITLAGCATQPAKPADKDVHVTIRVTLLPTGLVSVGGKTVGIPALGKTLKSMGATRRSGIMVTVPANVSAATLTEISKSLAAAGFQFVGFSKPLEQSSTVSNKNTVGATAPTRAPVKASRIKSSGAQKPVRSGTL